MIETLLNKENQHHLDLSVFINFSPDELLFYYYDSNIDIALETYLQVKDWLSNNLGNPDNLSKWLDFIDNEIGAGPDLDSLHMSEFLNSIGPFYYCPTNTRFHFHRFCTSDQDALTSADFAHLYGFHKLPLMDRALQKYSQSRKITKKTVRSKDELIRDIAMCSASLGKIAVLDEHINYISQFIQERQSICANSELSPPEPYPIPDKPQKPAEAPVKYNWLDSIGITKYKSPKPGQQTDYNHLMKVYFIRSREYEKACERFKKALQDWGELRESFLQKCRFEIQEAASTLKDASELQSVYKDIIRKSYIHNIYQNIDTLNKFRHYLETGRAEDLQDCMNIYEVESHWVDIKAGQERIENTIYHLQPDNEAFQYANEEVKRLIASTLD